MKIQLLIATSDQEYADALYTVLAKRQADIFELGLCSNPAKLEDMLLRRTYDICLLEPEEGAHYQLERVRLPLILQGSHTTTFHQHHVYNLMFCSKHLGRKWQHLLNFRLAYKSEH